MGTSGQERLGGEEKGGRENGINHWNEVERRRACAQHAHPGRSSYPSPLGFLSQKENNQQTKRNSWTVEWSATGLEEQVCCVYIRECKEWCSDAALAP